MITLSIEHVILIYVYITKRLSCLVKSHHQILQCFSCHENIKNPLFEVAMELERIALEDQYFIDHKLYPNVDFYSGIILKAIGIPTSMFTVIFALARTVGWISHWKEMFKPGNMKIVRPRQLYRGEKQRPFEPLDKD